MCPEGTIINGGVCSTSDACKSGVCQQGVCCEGKTWYIDADGDGYGGTETTQACSAAGQYTATSGGDCNDEDAEVFPGGAAESCVPEVYSGKEAFWNQGACKIGVTGCAEDGSWGACNDAVVPIPEVCGDEIDNNCDGITDEEGACATSCEETGCEFNAGPKTPNEFVEPENEAGCQPPCGAGVKTTKEGWLEIDFQESVVDLPFAWVANSSDRSISKVDTKTGKEIARYSLAPNCGAPSRTAVDASGSVWVGCRFQGTTNIAYIAADIAQCIDKNGDGKIQTSTVTFDGNGNKKVSMLNFNQDECVLYNGKPITAKDAPQDTKNNPVPSCNIVTRALAVSKDSTIYFGGLGGCRDGHMWEAKYVYDPDQKFSMNNNPRLEVIDHWHGGSMQNLDWDGKPCTKSSSMRSYGYAVDSNGHVWVSNIYGTMHWIDPIKRRSCAWPVRPYGIAVGWGNRIWMGSWNGDAAAGYIFVPESKKMFPVQHNTQGQIWTAGMSGVSAGSYFRGATASGDKADPYGYFANTSYAGAVRVKVTNDDPYKFDARVVGMIGTRSNAVCSGGGGSSGVGMDGDGDLWIINMSQCGTSQITGKNVGGTGVIEVDPTKIVGWVNPKSKAAATAAGVKSVAGGGSFAYTYSDFLGQQFAAIVSKSGFYIQRLTGWGAVDPNYTTLWTDITVTGGPDEVPPVKVSYRVTDDEVTSKAYTGPFAMDCADSVCTYKLPSSVRGVHLDVKVTIQTTESGNTGLLKKISATGIKTSVQED